MNKNLKTPVFDWAAQDFSKNSQGVIETATGVAALEQVLIKAQQTSRGVYLVYANPENRKLHHKYGSDAWAILKDQTISEAVRISELKRAVRGAVPFDPWVKVVSAVSITQVTEGGQVMWYADFSVATAWDRTVQVEGVALNG